MLVSSRHISTIIIILKNQTICCLTKHLFTQQIFLNDCFVVEYFLGQGDTEKRDIPLPLGAYSCVGKSDTTQITTMRGALGRKVEGTSPEAFLGGSSVDDAWAAS